MPLTKVSQTVSGLSYGDPFSFVTSAGLVASFQGGDVTDNTNVFNVPDTDITLPDDAVTLVSLDFTNGEIVIPTTANSLDLLGMYNMTTVSGVVTVIEDLRATEITKTQVQISPTGLVLSPYFKLVAAEPANVWFTGSTTSGQIDETEKIIYSIGGDSCTGNIRGTGFTSGLAGPGGIAMDACSLDSGTDITITHGMGERVVVGFSAYGMLSIWWKVDALPSSGNFYIWMQRDHDNTGLYSFLRVQSDGTVSGRFYNNGGNETLSTAAAFASADTWYHTILGADSDGGFTDLYMNGVEEDTGTIDTWDTVNWTSNMMVHKIGNADWSMDGDLNDSPDGAFVDFVSSVDQGVKLTWSNFSWHQETHWGPSNRTNAYNAGIGA